MASKLKEFGIGLGFSILWWIVLVISLLLLVSLGGVPVLVLPFLKPSVYFGWILFGLIVIAGWREERENALYSLLGYVLIPLITVVGSGLV